MFRLEMIIKCQTKFLAEVWEQLSNSFLRWSWINLQKREDLQWTGPSESEVPV